MAASITVWAVAILGSLWGCLAWFGSMFVVGENDSSPEVIGMTLALATPWVACVVAAWSRVLAGAWLIFAAGYYMYGTLAQRTYMIEIRHFSNQLSVGKDLEASLFIAGPLIAFGLFAIITGILKWPPQWKRSASTRTTQA